MLLTTGKAFHPVCTTVVELGELKTLLVAISIDTQNSCYKTPRLGLSFSNDLSDTPERGSHWHVEQK